MSWEDDRTVRQRCCGLLYFRVPGIVSGNDELNGRLLVDHLGEGPQQQRYVLVGLPLAQIEKVGRLDVEVPLPGGFRLMVAGRGESSPGSLADRLHSSGGMRET